MPFIFRYLRLIAERIWRPDLGQGVSEYALTLALVAIVSVLALSFLGSRISAALDTFDMSLSQGAQTTTTPTQTQTTTTPTQTQTTPTQTTTTPKHGHGGN